jgi:hypothetical protein
VTTVSDGMHSVSKQSKQIIGDASGGLKIPPVVAYDSVSGLWHVLAVANYALAVDMFEDGYQAVTRILLEECFSKNPAMTHEVVRWHFWPSVDEPKLATILAEDSGKLGSRPVSADVVYESLGGDVAEQYLYIPGDLIWFDGHFPDHPILPGVVQLDWAIELGKKLGFSAEKFTAIPRVKFSALTLPGMIMKLSVERKQNLLKFRLESSGGVHSQGLIGFD